MNDRQRFIELFGADQVEAWDRKRALERRWRRHDLQYRITVAGVLIVLVVGVLWLGVGF